MSRTQHMAGVWKFLEMSGVLDTGSEMDVAQKRREYWNMRKRLSKQEKRKKETEFKIYFTDQELSTIAIAAKVHGISRTRYIKQAALAYTAKRHLVLDRAALNHITQLLSLNSAYLQEVAELMPSDAADVLLKRMASLERQVLTSLFDPTENEP